MAQTNYSSYIDQSWDSLALDDGSFFAQQNDYKARLEDRNGNTIQSEIDSVRYSPQINSAPSITVDVEPRTELEGTSYLNGFLDVFVDGNILFAGKIKNIELSQRKEDWYTIKAYSPGRELSDTVIDKTFRKKGKDDVIAKIIDRHNDYHTELKEVIDTSQETIESGSFELLTSQFRRGSGEISYDISQNADQIESLNIKAYSTSNFDVTIETNSNTYSETVSALDTNQYGEWVSISPSGLDSASYTITFDFSATDSILFDWIALTEQELTREVDPTTISTSTTGKTVSNVSSQGDFEEAFREPENTEPWEVSNGELKLLQTLYLFDGYDDFDTASYTPNSDDYVGGSGLGFGGPNLKVGDNASVTFDLPYDMENAVIYFRDEFIPKNSDDVEAVLPRIEISVEGEVVRAFKDGSRADNTIPINELDWNTRGRTSIDSDNIEVKIEITKASINFDNKDQDGYGRWGIDHVAVVDDRFSYNFDNTVDGSGGELDGPQLYPSEYEIQGKEQIISENIDEGTLSVNTTNGEDIKLGLSYDGGGSWNYENFTQSTSLSPGYPSLSITPSFSLSRTGSRTGATPKEGFNSQIVESYDLSADTNDFIATEEIEIEDNRLSAISSIADNSNLIFRWEGNQCLIFYKGDRQASVDLREENVTSSIDIEDVYSSAHAKGQIGIESGTVQAQNPPSFIDRHKEIRDRDIETQSAAIQTAVDFLQDNSDIEYTGKVDTLPTRVPLGEELPGAMFTHGENSIIKSANYSKRRTSLDTGKINDIAREIVLLDRESGSSKDNDTNNTTRISVDGLSGE